MTAPFAASPAFAQAEPGVNDDNVIIVTAQRRAEALENVPMSVTALSQEMMARAGVDSVQALANVTSGYQLGRGGSTPQPAIRGVTTLINGSYENNVAIYVDGLYQSHPIAIAIDLPNIAGVQVLKGPQGTLYGRNATGGAILIDTISPTENWQGKLEGTYANFDDRRIGGVLSGPLAEGIGISVAGYTRRTDGYHKRMSRTNPGQHDGRAWPISQDSVRTKLSFDFSEALNVTVGYNYTFTEDGRGVQFSPIENVEPFYLAPGGDTRPTQLGETANDLSPTVNARQHEFYGKITLDTGIGQLRSITGYADTDTNTFFDFDGSYIPAFYGTNEHRDKTLQQSLDLSIDAINNLDLIVGGQYFRIKAEANTKGIFGGPYIGDTTYDPTIGPDMASLILNNDNYFNRVKEAWAVFADATFNVGALAVTVGGRYSEETQDVRATRYGVGGAPNGPIVYSPTIGGADKGSKYKKFTPRASLRYELARNTNVYASYSKGFRSGEWNGTIPFNNPAIWTDVKQESIDAYEVGFKHGGSRLRFDVAAFYYDYTNLQVSNVIVFEGNVTPVLQNAPSAEIYGAEANISFAVTDNFNIRAGGTWLHARYGKGFIFNGIGVSDSAANGGGAGINTNSDPLKTYQNVSQVQDISGLQMSRAPNFDAYFGADYTIPMGEGGITLAGNVKYTDDYVVSNPSVWGNDPSVPLDRQREQRFIQKGYVLANASLTYTDPSDSYYVKLWGNNLTDKKYKLHYNGTNTFGTYAPMAEPRTYGVTVGIKFAADDVYEAAPLPPPPPPPPPAEPAPPPPVVCNKGPYIVFFDWDRSDVTPEAGTVLDSAVSAYGNCESVPIMLAGHSDRSGSAQYNVGLSQRRNASVRDYLTARGIPDAGISSEAFGEGQPRVATSDGVRELQNRRVEITYGPGSGM